MTESDLSPVPLSGSRLAADVASVSFAQYVALVISVGVRLFLARRLLDEAFGFYALALSLAEVGQVMTSAKLTVNVVQFGAEPGLVSRTLRLVHAQAALSVLLGGALTWFAAKTYAGPVAGLLAAVVALQVVGYYRSFYQAVLESALVLRPVGTSSLLSALVTAVLIPGLSIFTSSACLLVAKDLIQTTVALLLLMRDARRVPAGARPTGIRSIGYGLLLGNAFLLLLQTHAINIAERVDVLVLGGGVSTGALGQYGQARWVVATAVSVLALTIGPLFAIYARSSQRTGFREGALSLSCWVVGRLSLIGAGLAALLPDLLVRVLLGSGWHQTAHLLRVLAPAILLQSLFMNINAYLVAAGRLRAVTGVAWLRALLVACGAVCLGGADPVRLALVYEIGLMISVVMMGGLDLHYAGRVIGRELAMALAYAFVVCAAYALVGWAGWWGLLSLALAVPILRYDVVVVRRLLGTADGTVGTGDAEPRR
ncbi:MAG: hypothetical protein L0216_19450 [Planctomycetales bacterium]|nr:hypothetical protein [Planctomycetales bacterium]